MYSVHIVSSVFVINLNFENKINLRNNSYESVMVNKIYVSLRGEDFNILSRNAIYMFLTQVLKAPVQNLDMI